jgi:hypothetical protein
LTVAANPPFSVVLPQNSGYNALMEQNDSGLPHSSESEQVERRKSLRLRMIIDQLQTAVAQSRLDLLLQADQIQALRREVETLRRRFHDDK